MFTSFANAHKHPFWPILLRWYNYRKENHTGETRFLSCKSEITFMKNIPSSLGQHKFYMQSGMYFFNGKDYLKELQNCFSCITFVWSLFCSVWFSRLSVFWLFVFLYLWFLDFSFIVVCSEFNFFLKRLNNICVIRKDNQSYLILFSLYTNDVLK